MNFYNGLQGYPYQIPNQASYQNENAINWVQGESGAKSWFVAPGKTALLMDSENNVFYLKSTDQSGMPMPLRIFDYKERTQQAPQATEQPKINFDNYVTREELDQKLFDFMSEVNGKMAKTDKEAPHGKLIIPGAQ